MVKLSEVVSVNKKAQEVLGTKLAEMKRKEWIAKCPVILEVVDSQGEEETYKATGLANAAGMINEACHMESKILSCSKPYTIKYIRAVDGRIKDSNKDVHVLIKKYGNSIDIYRRVIISGVSFDYDVK
jgi:hypothetical protein